PTHQHAHDALYRAYRSPESWKNDVAIANGRIAGGGKIEARLPGWKTLPAIEPCPQQNLRNVQNDERGRKPIHQHRGMPRVQAPDPSRDTGPCPVDENGHPGGLEPERQRHQNDCRATLANKAHGVLSFVSRLSG